jgi:hypothetical protein
MKKSVFESLMSTVADHENIENINSIPESIRHLIKNYENIAKKKIKLQE